MSSSGCAEDGDYSAVLSCVRGKTPQEILKVQGHLPFSIVWDGDVLPANPTAAYAEGKFKEVCEPYCLYCSLYIDP